LDVDDEAWHAEDAVLRRVGCRRAQRFLRFHELRGVDAELAAQGLHHRFIERLVAGGPEHIEDAPHDALARPGGERQPEIRQRVERMVAREAEGDAELARPPGAPAVGPFALRRYLRWPLLSPVLEQPREEHRLV